MTEFTERAHVALPLIQAPMAGGITTPELVAAVSKAGAVGSLGAAMMQPDELRKAIHRIREMTRRPFNVNLFAIAPLHKPVSYEPFLEHLKKYEKELKFTASTELHQPPSFEAQVEVLLKEAVPIFSFTFGIAPLSVIRDFHRQGALVIGTATHLNEALALQEAGVDFIVVQGKEAGGHRGTFLEDALLPTLDLVKQIHAQVKKPLIASGGIMHPNEVRLALKAGAAAVQAGTAFITCHESGASPAYKKALLEWKSRGTVLTSAFTGRRARAVQNRFIQELGDIEVPAFPIAQSLTAPMRKAATAAGNAEFMSLWAGEHYHLCNNHTAAELVAHLTSNIPS
jgi:nitronate monooxygenase